MRLADERSFFWKRLLQKKRRIDGVEFAMKSSLMSTLTNNPIDISKRLMKVRLPLINNRFTTIFSCYTPTLAASAEYSDAF